MNTNTPPKSRFLKPALWVTLAALLVTVVLLVLRVQSSNALKHEAWTVYPVDMPADPSKRITAIAPDQEGRIWVGTSGVGLKLLASDGGLTSYTTENSALTSDAVNDLVIDDQGRVWIATDAGLNMVTPDGDWSVYDEANSALPDQRVRELAVDEQDRVWVGTYTGLVVLSPDGGSETIEVPGREELIGSYAEAMAIDSQGRLWIAATVYSGPELYRLDRSGQWQGFQVASIGDLAIDEDDRVWISRGIQGDLIMIDNTDTVETILDSSDYFGPIAVDDHMRVWVLTGYLNSDPGIAVLTPTGEWKAMSAETAGLLDQEGAAAIALDAGDRIWVAQAGTVSVAAADLALSQARLAVDVTRLKWAAGILGALSLYLWVISLPARVRLAESGKELNVEAARNQIASGFGQLLLVGLGAVSGAIIGGGIGLWLGGIFAEGDLADIAWALFGAAIGAIVGAILLPRGFSSPGKK